MRIQFDNVLFGSMTGPNTFASRLSKALIEMGHDVTLDPGDVSLVFIEPSGRPLSPKVVQRLDGIWFKPTEFATKNVGIRALYDKADSVIFQSDFDYKMIKKWFGNRPQQIIGNGIEPNFVHEVTIPELAKIRSKYEKVFVC